MEATNAFVAAVAYVSSGIIGGQNPAVEVLAPVISGRALTGKQNRLRLTVPRCRFWVTPFQMERLSPRDHGPPSKLLAANNMGSRRLHIASSLHYGPPHRNSLRRSPPHPGGLDPNRAAMVGHPQTLPGSPGEGAMMSMTHIHPKQRRGDQRRDIAWRRTPGHRI